jgi:hypothetical protein
MRLTPFITNHACGRGAIALMATVIVRNVKVRDLPNELRRGLDAGPEDVVEVTVDAGRRKVAELLSPVQEIGIEAERHGLTDEKLGELFDCALRAKYAEKLAEIGVKNSAVNIRDKVAPGAFSAVLFAQCLRVIGCDWINLT